MSTDIDNLVLDHLRHILGRVDQIAEDLAELKQRKTALEGGVALVKREVAYGDETDARKQSALDRLRERIERRLGLTEA